MSQLRIALTLPGEASLGAFQAGAASALVVAVQGLGSSAAGRVRVDVMTGTSSGSLTAVLAAHALLTGRDPVDALWRAWVTEPTIEALRGRDGRAPLTLERAREVATQLLFARAPLAAGAQTTPVMVNFALTSLRGFNYLIRQFAQPAVQDMTAVSHLDWAEHKLDADTDWAAVVESAIASASHPAAFPPTLLDRGGLKEGYERNGVKDFPDCPVLWYADGGLLDREPLGRCLKVAHLVDGPEERAHDRRVLLVRPEPEVRLKADDPAWTEDDRAPTWTTALARALRILVTHSLYEDMRRVEKVNRRIAWRQDVIAKLAPLMQDDARTKKALRALVTDIRRQKGDPREDDLEKSVAGLLGQLLDEATGLAGKHTVAVEVVSSASAADVAGGSLLNFGGFLGERLRANDFLVGYAAMVEWMRTRAATEFGAGVAAAEDRAAKLPGWIGGVRGRRRLSWRARADVVRIAGRAARIGLRGGGPSRRV
jgi:predicted acylesterase/phospholipase RssA